LSPSSPKKGQKKLSFKEERELETLEKEIGTLEERKTEIEKAMGNPASLDREAVNQLGAEFKKIESDLLERVNRWEALETKKASFQT
jgi:ATP-binding cassette subfamily F protein uup